MVENLEGEIFLKVLSLKNSPITDQILEKRTKPFKSIFTFLGRSRFLVFSPLKKVW